MVLEQHFRRHVLRTAAEAVSHIVLHGLGKAVVGKPNVSLTIDDDVLRLQISVKNPLGVEMADGCQGLQEVELGVLFLHPPDLPQQVEQFPAVAVLHAEDEVILRLEAQIELGDEGMATAFLEDLPLILHDVLLLVLDDEVLTDHLHRHQSSVASRQVHLRESTRPQAFDDLEIVQKIASPVDPQLHSQQLQPFHAQLPHLPVRQGEQVLHIKALCLEIDVLFLQLPPDEVGQIGYLRLRGEGEGELEGARWPVEADVEGKQGTGVGLGELVDCEIVFGCADALAGLGVRRLVGLAGRGCRFDEANGRFFDGDAFHWAFKHRKNTG